MEVDLARRESGVGIEDRRMIIVTWTIDKEQLGDERRGVERLYLGYYKW
jgi:hypothetical protein